jgi:predicted metal-dependent HD superfamily phosphohydrolase
MPQPDRPTDREATVALEGSWDQLVRVSGVSPPAAAAVFADLVQAYSSPERHYHTLHHIRQVLDTLEAGRALAKDQAALQWAAWFHDAVYDSQARDNEDRSAARAEQVLTGLGLSPPRIALVRGLILDTKTHHSGTDDYDHRLFLDADLAILGADADSYDAYALAIRQEYAWVPEPDYRAGRQAVLRTFLLRPRIYLTEALFADHESQARANLEREIQALG